MEQSSIAQYLVSRGFNKVFRFGNPYALNLANIVGQNVYMVYLIDADVPAAKLNQLFAEKDKLYQDLRAREAQQNMQVSMLTLVLGSHASAALEICRNHSNCWYLDKLDRKIYLYDNQISDYCNLRTGLEGWLEEHGVVFPYEITKDIVRPYSVPAYIVSGVCILVTVLMYLGVLDVSWLTLDAVSLFSQRQWYRLLTSMFCHQEITHLMMNLLMLNIMAPYAEYYYGRLRMAVGYFLSGIAGGVVSMLYSVSSGNLYSSLGASGAIYGLIGMTLFQIIMNRRKFDRRFFARLLVAVSLVIIGAVYSPGVDHMAHIGGFVAGYLLGAVVSAARYLRRRHAKKKEQV